MNSQSRPVSLYPLRVDVCRQLRISKVTAQGSFPVAECLTSLRPYECLYFGVLEMLHVCLLCLGWKALGPKWKGHILWWVNGTEKKKYAPKTYFSHFRCECWESGYKHTQTGASGNPVVFLDFLSVLGLFTQAGYIISAHWWREMDCVGRGWKFGEYYNFALCRSGCVWAHSVCSTLCTATRPTSSINIAFNSQHLLL